MPLEEIKKKEEKSGKELRSDQPIFHLCYIDFLVLMEKWHVSTTDFIYTIYENQRKLFACTRKTFQTFSRSSTLCSTPKTTKISFSSALLWIGNVCIVNLHEIRSVEIVFFVVAAVEITPIQLKQRVDGFISGEHFFNIWALRTHEYDRTWTKNVQRT